MSPIVELSTSWSICDPGRLTERLRGLEAMTEKLRDWLADALEQRDRWQEQAYATQRLLAAPATAEPKPEPMSWWRWLRSLLGGVSHRDLAVGR
jgi:hypothetical protein